MKDLFGLELPTAVTFAIAFVVVLALIGILAWAVRRFGATRLEAARSRQPRLAVVDSAAVDGRRKLVIVRRDNVEHLLMIGGPTDVVVEASIVRGGAVATRETPAVRAGGDNLPRAMPLPDSTLWPLQPEPVAAPAPAAAFTPAPAPVAAPAARVERSMRLHVDPRILTEHRPTPEVRTAPEPRIAAPEPRIAPAEPTMHWPSQPEAAAPTRAQTDHLAGLAADLARPAAEVRHAPQPAPAVAPAPAALTHSDAQAGAGDQNLAEMAQRLEAALRRPMAQQHAAAAPQPAAPQPAPQHAPAPQAAAPQVFAQPAHQAAPAPQAAPAQRPAPQRTAAAAPKGGAQPKPQYDNLEQEMASLLRTTRENVTAGGITACVRLTTAAVITLLVVTASAQAQDVSISFGQGAGLTERVIQLIALLTVLSLAPSILVMMTSFTRIVVVLSLLRTALGTATAPPNAVIVSLALFLTAFVMGPAFQNAYDTGVKPLLANEITPEQAFERASVPFRAFMLKNVRDKDLKLFNDLSREPIPAQPEQISLRILIPAFMISELKRAFEIGFLLFLPFLIIDLVVASVLMSMGMMMLPPVVVSLPFKLIFFVLVDGWSLVAGSLVQSYGPT